MSWMRGLFSAARRVSRGQPRALSAGAAVTSTMGLGVATCHTRTGLDLDPSPEARARVMAAREASRSTLRPMIEPYNTGFLEVRTAAGTLHRVYYEECGNPDGKPVVFVHGGPGGSCGPSYRCVHDPAHYRIVLFDQRGCGKSTPHASLDENTTWTLVEDMERIRCKLGIDKWQVFGGSWGSTLALVYAECHPERVSELVLRGIFMLRSQELQWYYQKGASFIFPDRWEEYLAAIPQDEHKDLISAYRKRLISPDREVQLAAARAWTQWENTTSNLFPVASDEVKGDGDMFALSFARIENHFFWNKGFFDYDDWILDHVHRIQHIPTVIIQGRYDVVCPAKSAWDLHKAFPAADFRVVADSGHSMMEPGTLHELVQATERFK